MTDAKGADRGAPLSAGGAAARLRAERPALHGAGDDPTNLRIDFDVLDWLATRVAAGARTLETGCGYSSIVIAAAGADHCVVSPTPAEHARVAAWCEEHGVPTARISFVAEPSERALPALGDAPLDLVIVDGCHAFPWPFLDWFYTAEKLRVGGHVIVDDVHLRTGAVLRDFLRSEAGRWSLVRDFRTATLFRKTSEDVLAGAWWGMQPWGAKPMPRWRRRLQVAWQALTSATLSTR